jgi:hypothetical protein
VCIFVWILLAVVVGLLVEVLPSAAADGAGEL